MREMLDIEDKKNLVAVHFANGLGNFLQLTFAVQALAEHFDARIDLILDRSWQDSRRQSVVEFCETWPLINKVKNFQDGFSKDDYVQLFYSRHGENCEAMRYFKEHCGYESAGINWRAEKANEVDYYMNEVHLLGYRGSVPSPYCIEGCQLGFDFKRLGKGNGDLHIGFCNGYFAGSHWKWERKGWPYFGELAQLMRKFFNPMKMKIHLFGRGQKEQEWADSVMERNADMEAVEGIIKVMDYDMEQVVAVMRRMHLLVTTDTGLMHLADALGVPMVALFGPTLVSKNGPYNKQHRIARSPLRCAPCQHGHRFVMCKDWKCMRELKPWMVLKTIREYLHELYVEDNVDIRAFREGLFGAFSLVRE